MHDEHELFSQLRDSHELSPSKEFNQKTISKLIHEEKTFFKKKKAYRYSTFSFAILTSVVLFFWISTGNGSSFFISMTGMIPSTHPADEKPIEIYVYHTHSQESFLPELKTDSAEQAHSKIVNIGMVGEHLSKALQKRGVIVKHEKHDFIPELQAKNLDYSQAYELSRPYAAKTVQQNAQTLDMIIDLHRESQTRQVTTLESGGKTFGRISFFVSSNIKNFDEVKGFAESVHEKLEEKNPGLSRGIFIKNNRPLQSTYNQDLFNRSLSINIGGLENTLDEEYRTAEVLAEVLSEIQSED